VLVPLRAALGFLLSRMRENFLTDGKARVALPRRLGRLIPNLDIAH
jgi:hypothetical protein